MKQVGIFFVGIIVGGLIASGLYLFLNDSSDQAERKESDSALAVAQRIAEAFHKEDFDLIASFISDKGVRISPHAYIDLENDLILTQSEIANGMEDQTIRFWGISDGAGEDIRLTLREYVQEVVLFMGRNYAEAPLIGVNQVVSSGNLVDNTQEVYPDATFIEFYYPGSEEFAGLDWSSLKVVLRKENNQWILIGIVNAIWSP